MTEGCPAAELDVVQRADGLAQILRGASKRMAVSGSLPEREALFVHRYHPLLQT